MVTFTCPQNMKTDVHWGPAEGRVLAEGCILRTHNFSSCAVFHHVGPTFMNQKPVPTTKWHAPLNEFRDPCGSGTTCRTS